MLHFLKRSKSHSFSLETSHRRQELRVVILQGMLKQLSSNLAVDLETGFSSFPAPLCNPLSKKAMQCLNKVSEFHFSKFTEDVYTENAIQTLSNRIPKFQEAEVGQHRQTPDVPRGTGPGVWGGLE